MKKLQALHNEDDNKIVKEVAQEKASKENSNFLIDLATIAMVAEYTEPTKDDLQIFIKACNHPNPES